MTTINASFAQLANRAAVMNTNSTSASTSAMSGIMEKDDFLKLFLTTLQHQDPFNAMDTNEMMSQMSQLTLIEQVQNMSKAVEAFSTATKTNAFESGMKFLGKSVEAIDTDGNELKGTVDSVRVNAGNVELLIGDKLVPLQQVVSVSNQQEG